MSFFLSPLGNEIQDPFFGSPMHSLPQMNSMMNSMLFSNGFGGMMQSPLTLPPLTSPGLLCPFTFPSIEVKFEGLDMTPQGNGHSFSSSTVLRLSNGPDGRPQVYQAHSSMRTAPGGVRETKKSECDTRSGVKKLAIGHHIGERGHVMERQHNYISGEQEEHQEFINISEDEAEDFSKEFEDKVKRGMAGIQNRIEDVPRIQFVPAEGHGNIGRRNRRLALLPSTSGSKCSAVLRHTLDDEMLQTDATKVFTYFKRRGLLCHLSKTIRWSSFVEMLESVQTLQRLWRRNIMVTMLV